MELITNIFRAIFGGGRNLVAETAQVFRPNAEAQAQRGHDLDAATLNQLAAEFAFRGQRGWFDRFMDGLNRLPRPMMVLGVFGILMWTAIDPIAAAQVFTSWAIIPSEFWYVVLAIVAFYFGGRYQAKVHRMQERLASVAASVPAIMDSLTALEGLRPDDPATPGTADMGRDARASLHALEVGDNPALAAWNESK